MKIQGANLGTQEVEYKLLSEYPFFSDERQEVVKKLEQLYLNLFEESKGTDIQPFPQKEGKVEILSGMINHRCSNSLDSLRTLSQYGILASEWFGQIESEREGVFCSFVDRIHSEEKHNSRAKVLNTQRMKSRDNSVVLFLDSTNPIMEKLLHLDFFEYVKIKQLSPEKISELYTSEELELFEKIIEPFSPCGKNFHIKNVLPYCDWSAIPGGIPSALVNGICTKTKIYSMEEIEEITKLFPSATIFNGDLEIIYTPKKEKSTQDLGRETLEEQRDVTLLYEIETEQTRQEKAITNQRESQEKL